MKMIKSRVYMTAFLVIVFLIADQSPCFTALSRNASVKFKLYSGIWVLWDDLSVNTRNWGAGGDGYNLSVSISSSAYMQWNNSNSASSYAEIDSGNLGENWRQYSRIRVSARCSSTGAPIDIMFFDGTNWQPVKAQAVSAANSWQDLEWDLPSGSFDWSSLKGVFIRVNTDSAPVNGSIYVKNIKLMK